MNISLLKILYCKEIRSGRLIDYGMILMVGSLILYTGVHIITPFMVLLLSDRFAYPIWHRQEEQFLYSLIGKNSIRQVLLIRKLVFLIESNVLFVLLGFVMKGFNFGLDIVNFNCYLFLFLLLSDYLFNTHLSANYLYKKWFLISILLFVSIIFSLIFLFIGTKINPLTAGLIFLVLMILLNFFSGKYLVESTNLKKYFSI